MTAAAHSFTNRRDSDIGGLLGIAFHPSFSGSGDVFLSYTKSGYDSTTPLVSIVSRFSAGSERLIAPASENVILTVGQPEAIITVGTSDLVLTDTFIPQVQ